MSLGVGCVVGELESDIVNIDHCSLSVHIERPHLLV